MAAVTGSEYPEQDAHDAYLEHLSDCLVCNPGAGTLCRIGGVLHARWKSAEEAQ